MKRLLTAVFIMTVVDAASTVTGVKLGVIEEANPFIQAAMTNQPILTGLVVCLAIGAILYGIYRVRHRIRWIGYAMGGVLVVKIGVIALHINWITQVLRAL